VRHIVGAVHPDPGRLAVGIHGAVDRLETGGRHHEAVGAGIAGIRSALDGQRAELDQLSQLITDLGGDDGHHRPTRQQDPCLAGSNRATADDQAGSPLEVERDRVVGGQESIRSSAQGGTADHARSHRGDRELVDEHEAPGDPVDLVGVEGQRGRSAQPDYPDVVLTQLRGL